MKKTAVLLGSFFLFTFPVFADVPVCGSVDDTWLGACVPAASQTASIKPLAEVRYIGQSVETPQPTPTLSVVKSIPVSSASVLPTAATPLATIAPTAAPTPLPTATSKPVNPTIKPKSTPTPTAMPTPTLDTSLVAYEMRKTKEKKLAYPVQSSPRTDISSLLERKNENEYAEFERLLQKEIGLQGVDTSAGFSRAKAVEAILITQNASLLTPLPKETIFPDVLASSPSSPFIKTLKAQMAIDGYDDGFFRSDKKINLAESYKMISISFGMSEYSVENKGNDWYVPFKDVVRREKIAPALVQKADETFPNFSEFSKVLWNASMSQ